MENNIIFTDIDGTLVNGEASIPASAVNAIKEMRSQGSKVFVCTGRSRSDVRENVTDCGFDGFVCSRGAYVEVDGEVVINEFMPHQEAIDIIKYLEENGYYFYVESDDGIFGCPGLVEYFKERHPNFIEFANSLTYGENLYRDNICKVCIEAESMATYDLMASRYPQYDIYVFMYEGNVECVEIGLKDFSKATGIKEVMNYLKLENASSYAIGDDPSDIAMFEVVDNSIAMGNADEKTRQAASFVTDLITQDGFYKAFKHFGLVK